MLLLGGHVEPKYTAKAGLERAVVRRTRSRGDDRLPDVFAGLQWFGRCVDGERFPGHRCGGRHLVVYPARGADPVAPRCPNHRRCRCDRRSRVFAQDNRKPSSPRCRASRRPLQREHLHDRRRRCWVIFVRSVTLNDCPPPWSRPNGTGDRFHLPWNVTATAASELDDRDGTLLCGVDAEGLRLVADSANGAIFAARSRGQPVS
jgi:hypothetical protein